MFWSNSFFFSDLLITASIFDNIKKNRRPFTWIVITRACFGEIVLIKKISSPRFLVSADFNLLISSHGVINNNNCIAYGLDGDCRRVSGCSTGLNVFIEPFRLCLFPSLYWGIPCRTKPVQAFRWVPCQSFFFVQSQLVNVSLLFFIVESQLIIISLFFLLLNANLLI